MPAPPLRRFFSALGNYASALGAQHRDLIKRQRNLHAPLQWSALVQLWLIVFAMLTIAAIGKFSSGYHFAFHSINAMSAVIPEFVLHNITVFGDGALLLTLILLFSSKQAKFHWLVFVAAILGGMVSNVLKEYFDAARPPAVLDPGSFNLFGRAYKHHSFPSGHTLTAFLLASVSYYYVQKFWLKGLLLIAAVLVGLSRVWLGIHWPMDALVGGALGVLCGSLAIIIANRWPGCVNIVMHRIVLGLMMLAALILLFDKNDYRLALPLLYVAAIAALWQTVKTYFFVHSTPAHTPSTAEPISNDAIKLPMVPTWINAKSLFWIALSILTLYRIAVLFQPHLSLFYDEAYYYHWSLNPDLGYYSKPPMVAWCIILSTAIFGQGVVAIKLMASLLYGASSIVIFTIVKRYSASSNALIAALAFLVAPMIGFNSEFITTDAPLILFWSLALLFALKSLDTNALSHWLLLGIFTGFGMLSKYTMGALPLAVFLYLLSSAKNRPLLLTLGPWLAAITAGLLFSLNIYWNYANDWIALQHTQEISQTGGKLFNPISLLEFSAAQFFIFGPISSYILVKSLLAYRHKGATESALRTGFTQEHIKLLLWSTLLILGVIAIQALLSRAFPNWAGPWMVGGSILLALCWQYAFSGKRFYKLFGYSLAINLMLLSMFYHWPPMLKWLDIEANRKNDPFHRVAGWPALGEALTPYTQQYPLATLSSDSRDLLAYLGYYAMPGEFRFARWNPSTTNVRDYYDLTVNLRQWENQQDIEFLFVNRGELSANIIDRFEHYQALGTINTQVYTDQVMSVTVSYLKGFKGYDAQN